jgi:riboflavin-specific deaminase-like protein
MSPVVISPKSIIGTFMPGSSPRDTRDRSTAIDDAWAIVLAASRAAERATQENAAAVFTMNETGDLVGVDRSNTAALVAWSPQAGWEPLLPAADPRQPLLELYLPVASATSSKPITVGHLGQSLDGFIATHSGESQFVTGEENILHLHRMRALCDAVLVGAGTVAADDPQLTTRLVAGPSPLRVVLDPSRRLSDRYKLFTDDTADTLYICAAGSAQPGDTHVGRAPIVTVSDAPNGMNVGEVLALLRARGCHRVFVEGGGVTVSMFLQANLLDRLQVAVAPLIIGNGRPAIRVPASEALSECRRPRYRVFRMGGDVFFDCDLRAFGESADEGTDALPLVARII